MTLDYYNHEQFGGNYPSNVYCDYSKHKIHIMNNAHKSGRTKWLTQNSLNTKLIFTWEFQKVWKTGVFLESLCLH